MNGNTTDADGRGVPGFLIRGAARIIDVAYYVGVAFVVTAVVAVICGVLEEAGALEGHWLEAMSAQTANGTVLGILALFLYHLACESLHGSTLGKQICRIRVIYRDGDPCSFRGAFVRGVAWFLDSLFMGLVGFLSMRSNDLNQRFGDVWGHTVVVYADRCPASAQRSPIVFMVALLLGHCGPRGNAATDPRAQYFEGRLVTVPRTVALSYGLTFALGWAIMSACWVTCKGSLFGALIAPIAPLYFSVTAILGSAPGLGTFVFLVMFGAGAILVYTMLHAHNIVLIVFCHLCIIFYWLWTFQLCRTGL